MKATQTSPSSTRRGKAFAEAREAQMFWKSPAVRQMTVAICKVAAAMGTKEFSANDVKLEDHGGGGIAGTVWNRLAEYGVIAPACLVAGGEAMQKTVKNAGGNRIGVWRLKSEELAKALLSKNDALPPLPVSPKQPELMAA